MLRAQDELRRDTTLAWQGVRIYVDTQNKKRLSPLKDYLPKNDGATRGQPSLDYQRSVLRVIAAQHGLRVIQRPARKGGSTDG